MLSVLIEFYHQCLMVFMDTLLDVSLSHGRAAKSERFAQAHD
jgi:hypothetical protein